jgi:PAS domain S-box-containing protein
MNDSDKTKEQLIQEIELLRTLIDALPDRLYVKDAKSRFVICNKAVTEDTDLPFSEDPIGKNDFDLFPPEIAGTFYATEQEVIRTGKPMVNDEVFRTRRKDGQPNWSLCTKLPWRDKNGNVIGIIGSNRDVTEHKKAELALQDSEARYKAIFESAREGILVGIIETRQFMYANPAICKMFGYTAEELTRLTVNDIHLKEHLPYVSGQFVALMQDEVALTKNIPCLRKNGTVFYADISAARIILDNKACFVGFFSDTTERKHAEDALRESEQKYRLLVEQLPAITYTASLDETSTTLYVSPQTQEILGVSPEEYTADPDLWRKLLHPDDRNRVMAEIARSHQTGEPFNSEYRMLAKNGHTVWVRDNAKILKDDHGNPLYLQGIMHDITASKQAEEALRESEARYKAIFNSATEGIVVTDVETKRHKYANPAFCRMFGYTAEEIRQMSVYDIHPKEHMTSVIAGLEAQARGEKTLVQNVPCLHRNGTVFHADVDATSVVIDKRLCNVGLFTDITERKHAEEALRESEQKYRMLVEQLPTITYTASLDETSTTLYVSPQVREILGVSPEDYTTDPDLWRKLLHPDDRNRVMAEIASSHQTGRPFKSEYRMIAKNGHIVWMRDDAKIFRDEQDNPLYLQGVMYDITASKHAEEALRESEEKFRGIADRSFDMIFITDTRGFIKYLSPASNKIFGYKPEEMVGKNFASFLVESEIPKATKRFTEKLRGKKLDVLRLEAKKKDGSSVFIELSSSLIMQDSKAAGTQGIIKDVTERRKTEEQLKKAHEELETRVKQRTADLAKAVETLQIEIIERKRAEESLRSAEVRFRSIFENTIIGLYRTTPDGRILLANPALIKMMGCRSFKELAKFNVEKNGFDPSTPRSIFKERIKKEGRIIGLEFVWRRPNGTKLFVSESAFAVKDAKGKILYYEGTAQDITKRKEAEAKLMLYQQQLRSLASELSLAEERLRRRIAAELHDHIAQNLAISKIKLESLADNAEPDLVKSLNEVNGLISQTIEATRSLTFEISPPVLYELGFEAAVNWLAKQTRQRFGLEVEFADDGKPKPLNTDIRVLLFQAVRELLVNVVKHAKAKKVKVFTCRIQKNIQVTVEDNGVGFDIDAIRAVNDPAKGGFGLFNIRERLDQIGGSVIIHARAGKGTRITLTAPIEKQEKPLTRFSGARPDKNRKRRKKKERSA